MTRSPADPILHSLLITDFDGTVTDREFFELAQERLIDPGTPDYWAQYRAGQISHFDGLRLIFASIRRDEETVRQTVRAMQPDPDLAAAVQRLRISGWDVITASAGCAWYISQLLSEAGVEMTVYANPGRFEPHRGLIMELPNNSAYLSESTGIDKVAIVREALGRYRKVAYAGDGPPDLEPISLVDPEFRFARSYLAAELERRGAPFRPYRRWSEIADRLTGQF